MGLEYQRVSATCEPRWPWRFELRAPTPALRDSTARSAGSTVQDVHEAGDHYLVIGKVEGLGEGDTDKPLLFHQGRYRTAE
ncbi:flavin reductase family protein [Aeromicrobium sp.]|uniref:flavin reductase family protein n=1 Tax=Aeromicrobium sp. TaxID=1871063 RepID=UPI002FCB26E2